MSRPTVLIPEPIGGSGLEILEAECRVVAPWRDGEAVPDEALRRVLIGEADAVIVRLFAVRGDEIARALRLKAIAKHGVGVDSIDCRAARERGIPVIYAPGANSNAVAEHTLGLMLALARHVETASRALKEGRPFRREDFIGSELAGKTLVVIGLGRIGSRVARQAFHGFGMRVLAYDPYVPRASYDGPAVLEDSLEALLPRADYVSLHVPLTPETRRMIDGRALAILKSSARLINTSRGEVVDEAALVEGLESGRIAGAALDVFSEEPLPPGHPLARAPRTVLTPHIAGATSEAFDATSRLVARGVLDALHGRTPEHLVPAELM